MIAFVKDEGINLMSMVTTLVPLLIVTFWNFSGFMKVHVLVT
jgi:hypothetical protein